MVLSAVSSLYGGTYLFHWTLWVVQQISSRWQASVRTLKLCGDQFGSFQEYRHEEVLPLSLMTPSLYGRQLAGRHGWMQSRDGITEDSISTHSKWFD